MLKDQSIQQWHNASREELFAAQLYFAEQQYSDVLMYCYRAVEHSIKCLLIEQGVVEPSHTQKTGDLLHFIEPDTAKHYVDEQIASQWLAWADEFLSHCEVLKHRQDNRTR